MKIDPKDIKRLSKLTEEQIIEYIDYVLRNNVEFHNTVDGTQWIEYQGLHIEEGETAKIILRCHESDDMALKATRINQRQFYTKTGANKI